MKLFKKSCLAVALFSGAFFAACGGGGAGASGDLFVSIQQFESGSAGFFLMSTGGDMRVISNGTTGNEDIVNVTRPSGNLMSPFTVQDDQSPFAEVPVGWDGQYAVSGQSRVLSGIMKVGGSRVSEISSMVYYVSGMTRGYLEAVFPPKSDTNFDNALAALFGCVTRNSISTSNNTNGNVGGNVYVQDDNSRVLFPSASGTSLHMWFDFTSGRALIQLVAQKHYDEITWYDKDGNELFEIENVITAGAAFTAKNCTFRKTVN